jgi:hypothetical protein
VSKKHHEKSADNSDLMTQEEKVLKVKFIDSNIRSQCHPLGTILMLAAIAIKVSPLPHFAKTKRKTQAHTHTRGRSY